MPLNTSTYQLLVQKLDSFTRKFYTNQLIRGAIFSATYVLAFFMVINLLEYYFYLSTGVRGVLFFGFLLSSAAFVGRFFMLPLLHYYRLGKIISYPQSAQIIGTHFPEVKDKLLNVLQLHGDSRQDSSLLIAAIDQKINELKPIDFSFAIDLSKNRRYVKYLVPPVLLFLFVLIAAPNVLKEGTKRLYHYDTAFEKQAPFTFIIENKELKALQFENYTLQVRVDGGALLAEVYLTADKNTFKLKKKDKNLFTYQFTNLRQNTNFKLSANGFDSKEYTLQVVAKPVIDNFEVSCDYPAYTGKPDEVIKNMGDLVVPEGSRLTWHFNTQNVEGIKMMLGDSVYNIPRTGDNEYTFTKSVMQSAQYVLKVSNKNMKDADSAAYSLNVTPDLYPTINVNENRDSATQKYFMYVGDISDDYGLRRLTFNYQITRADSGVPNVNKSMDVNFNAGLASRFTYYWSTADMGIKPGDHMTYYFEVWDNDGIHGSKATRSALMSFAMPTLNELNKEITKDNKELKDELKQSMEQAKDLKEELHNMQDKLMDKNNMNWEDKKNLQQNIEKQKALQEQLKEIKDKLDNNIARQNEFKNVDPEIAEKQKKLQDLFNQVMSPEMKELYDKLQKMLEELQKKDALDKMGDMANTQEKLEKELDRMLELFKKLEFQQKMEETADKLDKLADKQDQLAQQQEKNADNKDGKDKDGKDKDAKSNEQLKQDQQKLNEELKDAKKDIEDLKKLNEDTKSGQDFKDVEKNVETADKQQQDAQQNQNQNQNKQAAQNQKSAANNMHEAASKLSNMKQQMEEEQNAEDMQAIRQLLKNIVQLSFDEEKLMADVKETNINVPRFLDLMKEQQRIRENSKMVEDSLYAVAKRQEDIKSFVTKEINNVNKFLGKSIDDMEDRNTFKAMANQQFVMTGYNNLALMLSEALQQMQQQQSESQSQSDKTGMKMCMKCKKPGNGLPNLSKMQKQLNDKISQLGEMMKKDGKGSKQGQGQGGQYSKEFAEMAQMQAQIRKELEKINQQENKDGKGTLGDLGQTGKQMEETEKNLVNKQITAEMMQRQQQILNKMLEAENAERQQDEKQERESHTGKDVERKLPPSLQEYLKAKQSEVDLYKTVPPALKPYYKSMAEKYFRSIAPAQHGQ